MEPTNFFKDIGDVKTKVWEIPDNLKDEWAPDLAQISSVEEVNKREKILTDIYRRYNQIVINYAPTTFAGSTTVTLYTVPQNKVLYLETLNFSGLNTGSTVNGMYTQILINDVVHGSLHIDDLSPAGANGKAGNFILTLNNAIRCDKNSTIKLKSVSDFGVHSACLHGWLEDIN